MRRRFILSILAVALLVSLAPLVSWGQRTRAALNMTLPELNFTGVTLADAIDFMRDISGANIHVNWPALEAVGVGKDTTINLRLRNVPLRKVLALTLREAGSGELLAWYVDQGIIEITTKELADEQLFTRVYPVDDLIMEVPDFIGPDFDLAAGSGSGGSPIGGGTGTDTTGRSRLERAQELIDVIQAIIEPDVWDINGGRAAIRYWNGSLIVTAPRSVHEALGGPIE